jgi:large subunit ribosomal protein L18
MNKKQQARIRRARKTRAVIQRLGKNRLWVRRSNSHIYAYLTTPCGAKVFAVASSLDESIRDVKAKSLNKKMAAVVGRKIAERALAAGIKEVAFDRNGYRYHGRIQALADAAREAGLEF